jgi:hypothetical protein
MLDHARGIHWKLHNRRAMKGSLNIPNMGEKIRNVRFIGMDMMILGLKWGSRVPIFLPFRGGGVGAAAPAPATLMMTLYW